jgi:hypothetical protein
MSRVDARHLVPVREGHQAMKVQKKHRRHMDDEAGMEQMDHAGRYLVHVQGFTARLVVKPGAILRVAG